ncbi:macro domain-like protein [Fomitopsis serialis]|uniref:macro domain-like protein n=1 Tax=Fomitopsis serialis TaxID=139415 RepID=UPI002007FC09|nr:macro domain-like protein [Neoantrodia serialis]KAH9917316.1 macro domain-like protein [Neoantrodia serialis]
MEGIQFVLFDISEDLVKAWQRAFAQHVPDAARERFTIIHSTNEDLSFPADQFDCIVSPANSYGRLDGSFDWYLAKELAPPDQFEAPTQIAQAVLYKQWRGYAPPGTCTLVPLKDTVCAANKYACSYIALCPTMRIPENVKWNREIVYNCMWSLLVALDRHNASVASAAAGRGGAAGTAVKKVLMAGLATGVGRVSAERCAQQMALAVKHYADASEHPQKWSSLRWDDALDYAQETNDTHLL